MLRILATALLALCLAASGAFATSLDDLVKVEEVYYKKFTDVPFTGVVDEGPELGAFKNGKREGPWVSYHFNGNLRDKATYKNGKREGHWIAYLESGQLLFNGTTKNGYNEGPWLYYLEDGTKDQASSGTYRNGVKVSD